MQLCRRAPPLRVPLWFARTESFVDGERVLLGLTACADKSAATPILRQVAFIMGTGRWKSSASLSKYWIRVTLVVDSFCPSRLHHGCVSLPSGYPYQKILYRLDGHGRRI